MTKQLKRLNDSVQDYRRIVRFAMNNLLSRSTQFHLRLLYFQLSGILCSLLYLHFVKIIM